MLLYNIFKSLPQTSGLQTLLPSTVLDPAAVPVLLQKGVQLTYGQVQGVHAVRIQVGLRVERKKVGLRLAAGSFLR